MLGEGDGTERGGGGIGRERRGMVVGPGRRALCGYGQGAMTGSASGTGRCRHRTRKVLSGQAMRPWRQDFVRTKIMKARRVGGRIVRSTLLAISRKLVRLRRLGSWHSQATRRLAKPLSPISRSPAVIKGKILFRCQCFFYTPRTYKYVHADSPNIGGGYLTVGVHDDRFRKRRADSGACDLSGYGAYGRC